MTRIEHVNIVVDDIEPVLAFLQAALPRWRVRASGHSEWAGRPRKWLHFGDDYSFITLNDNGEGPPRDLKGHAQGLAHTGFAVTGLDALMKRLETAGYAPRIALNEEPWRRNIYYLAGGLEFEFVEYLSDIPQERNASQDHAA